MNNKDKIVNVRFGNKEYEELKRLADELGIKVSEAVRRSVLMASGKLG